MAFRLRRLTLGATPFNTEASLDIEGLKANTQVLVERRGGKLFVFVPTGGAGEFYALSESERIEVIETVIETTAGAVQGARWHGICMP